MRLCLIKIKTDYLLSHTPHENVVTKGSEVHQTHCDLWLRQDAQCIAGFTNLAVIKVKLSCSKKKKKKRQTERRGMEPDIKQLANSRFSSRHATSRSELTVFNIILTFSICNDNHHCKGFDLVHSRWRSLDQMVHQINLGNITVCSAQVVKGIYSHYNTLIQVWESASFSLTFWACVVECAEYFVSTTEPVHAYFYFKTIGGMSVRDDRNTKNLSTESALLLWENKVIKANLIAVTGVNSKKLCKLHIFYCRVCCP